MLGDERQKALAASLIESANTVVVRIQERTAFPVNLLPDHRIAVNDVRMDWTSTGLAVLTHGEIASEEICRDRALARLFGLHEHANGLPWVPRTSHVDDASECLQTLGLVRGHRQFSAAVGGEPRRLARYLPEPAEALVVALCRRIDAGDMSLNETHFRRAAVLVASGVFKHEYKENLERAHPQIKELPQVLLNGEVEDACTALWSWTHGSVEEPDWHQAPHRDGARVGRATVRILGSQASGVAASDEVNAKGFAMSVEQLENCVDFLRARPLMYVDHDRSKPPGQIVLDAHLHCHDGKHQVHVSVAALTASGEERLHRGGGFSVGFHVRGDDQ